MDAGLHPGNIKSKQSWGRQTPWVMPGVQPDGGWSCHSVLFHQLLCRKSRDGVKPDKPEVIKVRKHCQRFWERYVLERRSSHSIKPCKLHTSRTETRSIARVKWRRRPMWHLEGTGVVKKGSNSTHEPKKQKGKKFSGFGKGSTSSFDCCSLCGTTP